MTKEKMQEAEVSLHVALHYIKNRLTDKDVYVSIDGAHIKTGDTIHFDISKFLEECNLKKIDEDADRWQGTYHVSDDLPRLIIHSKPGSGDVNIITVHGEIIYVESKKGDLVKKSGQEYPLMREAIGQLMTGTELNDNIIPVVAVPFTDKSFNLASEWIKYSQMKLVGIQFMLIREDGSVYNVTNEKL